MRRFFFPLPLAAFLFLAGCGEDNRAAHLSKSALHAPVYDATFRNTWNDGGSEVSSYNTERLRNGKLRAAAATLITRHAVYSEDERVPVPQASAPNRDLFSAMEANWIERFSGVPGPDMGEEMTTATVTLTSVDGRVPGVATKADFSFQGWNGQLFHQLLFDATAVRSYQYSYFANEGDEQITLAYPTDAVAGDALWFWARHMAAPALNPGEQQAVSLLPALRDVREGHRPLTWLRATLKRAAGLTAIAGKSAESFTVTLEDGRSESFFVDPVSPFRVLRWQNSDGEHADLSGSTRLPLPASPPVKLTARK